MAFLVREVILDKILVSWLEDSKGIQPEDYVMQLTLSVPQGHSDWSSVCEVK